MSTPVHVTVVQTSSNQAHHAIGAVVYGLVAITWAILAFNITPKMKAPAVLLAMCLGIIALVLWGIS